MLLNSIYLYASLECFYKNMIKGRHSICGVSPTEKLWWMVVCVLGIAFSISNQQAIGLDCGQGLMLAYPW